MNLQKKLFIFCLLFVSVLSRTPVNAATQISFPHDHLQQLETPGYDGLIIALVNNIPLARNGEEFIRIQVPGAHNTAQDIFFPLDGHQPTTQEAATWSLANIDNSLTSPITEWYMQMFGWQTPIPLAIPHIPPHVPANPPQMGFAPLVNNAVGAQNPTVIFELDNSMGTQPSFSVSERSYLPLTRKEMFWETFRKIASNPVGRVLLYRLLIEIRRTNVQGRGQRILAQSGDVEENLIAGNGEAIVMRRNNCRSIRILYGAYFSFNNSQRYIKFADNISEKTSALSINNNRQIHAYPLGRPLDVALFHEMLHWYHYLRQPDRRNNEKHVDSDNITRRNYIARVYLGDQNLINNEEWISNRLLSCEEIRTILGSPELAHPNQAAANQVRLAGGNIVINQPPSEERCFCNGDDLSENAYRASKRLFMRWGHNTASPQEIAYNLLLGRLPRYALAHFVARNCYNTIRTAQNIHPPVTDWRFNGQEAIFVHKNSCV